MAKIGIKGLTYAPYSTGGEGNAITYSGGSQLADYMVRADVNEERSDIEFYADDKRIDAENGITGVSIALELANMTDDMEKKMLGYVTNSGDLDVTDKSSPYVGVGFYQKERYKGAVTYNAIWVYKVQFSKDSDSTQTKGESIDFQTNSLTGNAMGVTLTSGGNTVYYTKMRTTVESAAAAWLKTKGGIS